MLNRANAHTPLAHYVMENIEDYREQLKQLCPSCKQYPKCLKRDRLGVICAFKRFAWRLAVHKYKSKECEKVECK